jgi:cell division protein FtsI (penicillin-binding protein 3)
MMHPETGEILALAQYPFFHPDDYRSYFNSKERIEETKVKAITDAHEPGSIMKPISLAITLQANKIRKAEGKSPIFNPKEKVDTSNGRFPGRSKPMTDTHFHHYLDMKLGMQKSSNIYFARQIQKVVQEFGDKWYRDELVRFGFGSKTGVELPGESFGLLPRHGKNHPNGRPEWSLPTPYSLAIGYNLQTTSLQMVRALAVFANGGTLVQPTLIRKIVGRDKDGNEEIVVDHTRPERVQQFPKILDEDIVKEVVRVMKLVTKRGGTARRADIYGYTEAGKTSTDMKLVNGAYSSKKHVASFVGFAPVVKPAFVLLVTMDEPEAVYEAGRGFNHHGGLAAAPVFREIGKRALEYLGVPPDDPFGYPAGDPRRDTGKADMMAEVEGLEKLYTEWNGVH